MHLRELCSLSPQNLHGEATFLEEYVAVAPEASPRSLEEETRPEVEVRKVEVCLRGCTEGEGGVKEF